MKTNIRKTTQIAAALLALIGTLAVFATSPAFARGGAMQNIMGSAGYQRALKESRERYRAQYYGQPYVQAPRVYPRNAGRHRHWRHRR